MSGNKKALTEIGKSLASHGFARIRQGEFGRIVNDVSQYVLIHRSKFDESLYVEAYVCTASDAQGISRFDAGQPFVGGRVSPGGVDYHDHSFGGDSEQIVCAIQAACSDVVFPWFDVFSTATELVAALDERQGVARELAADTTQGGIPYRRVSVKTLPDVFPSLVQKMAGHGFTLCRNPNYICFYKKAGWIWHVVLLEAVSAGVFLVVRVASWLPALQVSDAWTEDASPADFGSLILVNGGFLGDGGLSPRPLSCINISRADTTGSVVQEIEHLIVDQDNRFFQTQTTPADFLASVDPAYRRVSYLQGAFESIQNTPH